MSRTPDTNWSTDFSYRDGGMLDPANVFNPFEGANSTLEAKYGRPSAAIPSRLSPPTHPSWLPDGQCADYREFDDDHQDMWWRKDEPVVCRECGIIPVDRDIHRSWHSDIERISDAAYNTEWNDQ